MIIIQKFLYLEKISNEVLYHRYLLIILINALNYHQYLYYNIYRKGIIIIVLDPPIILYFRLYNQKYTENIPIY